VKIEQIEKLNKERTQGEWVARKTATNPRKQIFLSYQTVDADFTEGNMREVCKSIYTLDEDISNSIFIAAAPTITDQYIRARRFEADRYFIENVRRRLDNALCIQAAPNERDIIQAVLDELWAEVEGE
jgi:hypothetical protein